MVKKATRVSKMTISNAALLDCLKYLLKFYCLITVLNFFYLGDVIINATYQLTDENALDLSFIATTTKPTPINLSSHCYFNLGK